MKNQESFLSVIIPAFNEEDNIVNCVKRVGDALSSPQRAFEILVVNDGSTDRTLQRASSLSKSCDFCKDDRHGRKLWQTPLSKKAFDVQGAT